MNDKPGNDRPFDVLVIGGGQAGIPLAQELAGAGRRVGLAERSHLGGSCVNFGCTPTKAALASAQVAEQSRRAADYGVLTGPVRVDFRAVMERARGVARESREGLEKGMQAEGAPEWLKGQARLAGRGEGGFLVEVGGETYTAAQVVLNTGTRSVIPDIPGLRDVPFLHAGNWLDLNECPAHLAILGGGYIGLEMSQFYRRMGSEVTVIDSHGGVAGHEDQDVAGAVQRLLEREGIRFRLKTELLGVEPLGTGARLRLRQQGQEETLEVSHLFVATGRKPNTDDLGLETVGVRVDRQGIVEVDQRLATSVPGLWAAGDIRGGPMFTHTAWDDYRVLASQLLGDGSRTTERIVPYGLFTEPQLGRVGLSETQAREAGHQVAVSRFEMKKNGKAREIGEAEGFIKLVTEKGSGRILGAAVLASQGAEIVHSYIDVMNAHAPAAVIANAVHIHPTLAEAVQSAARALE